jgi:hypothetical protein
MTTPILQPSKLDPKPTTSKQKSSVDLTDLQKVLEEIILKKQSEDNGLDQDFNIDLDSDLKGMERIPDIVKSIREFSGNPSEYGSWKKSVDRILRIYSNIVGTTKYYTILNVIRNKIVGDADIALESYNTPLNWEKIAKCLNLHYADKRDLGTLEYQMTTLIQKNNSIHEFYQLVYQHLSLILNKLSTMEMSHDALNVMTRAYRDKALDTFVRGLKGDLPRLLSIKEPEDLPQALYLCLKLQNVDYRVQHSLNVQQNRNVHPPQVPPKKPINFFPQLLQNPQSMQRQNFVPNFQTAGPQFGQNFNPNPFNSRPQFGQNFSGPKPQFGLQFNQKSSGPKPQFAQNSNQNFKKPEPMDVDASLRSRAVNYQNRPTMPNPNTKRAPTPSQQISQQPNKFQRIFYTEQIQEENANGPENDQQQIDLTEMNEVFENYNEFIDIPNDPTSEEPLDNINFLE